MRFFKTDVCILSTKDHAHKMLNVHVRRLYYPENADVATNSIQRLDLAKAIMDFLLFTFSNQYKAALILAQTEAWVANFQSAS